MTRTELQRTEKCISSTCPERETEKQRERERENTCELLYHRIQLILLGMLEYYEHKD